MLKQFITKKRKMLYGYVNRRFRRDDTFIDPTWWDDTFYSGDICDSRTLAPDKSKLASVYHYASIELLLSQFFHDRQVAITGSTVLDIGSGAGHWLRFYDNLGAAGIHGVEVSKNACTHLQEAFTAHRQIKIVNATALQYFKQSEQAYGLINAIGVMFHITDDMEWEATLAHAHAALSSHGHLVVGGHFGWLDNLFVQKDRDGAINKVLRSRKRWERTLRNIGFSQINFIKNNAYLRFKDTLPENNLLIAKKA